MPLAVSEEHEALRVERATLVGEPLPAAGVPGGCGIRHR